VRTKRTQRAGEMPLGIPSRVRLVGPKINFGALRAKGKAKTSTRIWVEGRDGNEQSTGGGVLPGRNCTKSIIQRLDEERGRER